MNGEKKPIMKQKLTERSVKQFIQRYENWAESQGLNDDNKKRSFATAFESDLASQWFFVQNKTINEPAVTWEILKNSFIANCPKDEVEKELQIYDVSDHPQELSENPLAYIYRIRCRFGDNWSKVEEKFAVEAIVKQMLSSIRRYLQYRGVPSTWSELVKMISEYEGKGMKEIDDSSARPSQVEKPLTTIATPFAKVGDAELAQLTKALEGLTVKFSALEQKMERRPSRQADRGNWNRSRNQDRGIFQRGQGRSRSSETRTCYVCNKRGHVASTCWYNRANGTPGFTPTGNREGFRGGRGGRTPFNGPRNQRQWNQNPWHNSQWQNPRTTLQPALAWYPSTTDQGNSQGRAQ